jgi:hypothetical protein
MKCEVTHLELLTTDLLPPSAPAGLTLLHHNCYDFSAGWSSLVARWAHNPKVGGSNPPPATKWGCWPKRLVTPSVFVVYEHYNSRAFLLVHHSLLTFHPRFEHNSLKKSLPASSLTQL